MRMSVCFLIYVVLAGELQAQEPAYISPAVQKYVRVSGSSIVLEHVRVIDGTGKPAAEDQNVIVERGKIVSVKPGADIHVSADTAVLDLRGYTVMPGIVGMHDHLFYVARPDLDSTYSSEAPILLPQMTFSAPQCVLRQV